MIIEEGIYDIPSDLRAIIKDGKLIIKKRTKYPLGPKEYRCKDCVHRVYGHLRLANYAECSNSPHISGSVVDSWICTQQPKTNPSITKWLEFKGYSPEEFKFYYCAPDYGRICKYFKEKGKDPTSTRRV